MKCINIITPHLHVGGVANISYNYYQMFKKQGFNVKIFLLDDLPIANKLKIPPEDIVVIGMKTSKYHNNGLFIRVLSSLLRLPLILFYLYKVKGNVIFVHFDAILVGQLVRFLGLNKDSNFIFSLHTNIFSYATGLSGFKKTLYHYFISKLSLATNITFLTDDVSNKYLNSISNKVPISTIANIYHRYPVSEFNIVSSKKNIKHGILYSGRLSKEKNVDFIIEVYDFYRRKGGYLPLTIVGTGTEKEYLLHKSQKSDFAKDINFLGYVDDISDVYLNSQLLILASKNEGFGLVLLEAINCGLPIISANCPSGPATIFDPNHNILINSYHENNLGILLPVPDDNHQTYVDAIMKVERLGKLDINVIETAISHFEDKKIFKLWNDILI